MPSFSGMPGNDIFTGGIDNDTALGAAGDDSLSGADGSDLLVGGPGADTLDGGAGSDTLYSGDQSPAFNLPYYANNYVLPQMDTGTEVDTLKGGDGSDRIFAGYGDNVDGGANDPYGMGDYLYISFQGAPSGVTADFRLATQTIGGGVITNMEYVSYAQGSQFDDKLTMPGYTGGYSNFTAVSGMAGNDTLTAGYETGSLFGDEGNDVLDGRPSQYLSMVDGGSGDDTIYTNANTFAAAYGGTGNDTIYAHGLTHGGAGDDVIVMQQTYYAGLVYGDEGDDQITAAASGNSIAGGSGADTIAGGGVADSLFSGDFAGPSGGAADDMGLEHDQISGGAGDDTLAIGYGDDADGGAGNDSLRLSLGGLAHGIVFDTAGIVSGAPFTLGGGVIQNVETLLYLRGTEFADTLTLRTQSVQLTVDGGAGDDVIISQMSSVTVRGGDGDDRFVSGPAGDTFDGGNGNDTVDYGAATSAVTVNLATGVGGGGDNLIRVESVIATGFDDTVAGDGGANWLDGGRGVDTLSYGSANAGVKVALALQGTAQNTGGAGTDTVINFENLTGSAFGDTLSGDAGANGLDGGGGVDTVSYAVATVGVTVSLALQGQAQNTGGAGVDTISNFENLTGSALSDTLAGDAGANVLDGGGGTDLLSYAAAGGGVAVSLALPGQGQNTGGAGVDTISNFANLTGSAFNDTLIGNAGDNTLDGGGGVDTVSYASAGAGVTVSLALQGQAQATGGAGVDTLLNSENLTGSAFDDTLRGDTGANLLNGAAGADTINGGSGDDTITDASGANYLRGDDGNDSVQGGSGFDDINGNKGDDTIDGGSGGADWLVGGQGNDLITAHASGNILYGNLGNDTLVSGTGADLMRGGQGDDSIVGGSGPDWISGDRGADTISGGAGADIFHTFSGAGMDRVLDFSAAEGDRVQLDPGTIYTVSQVGADTVIDMGNGDQLVLANVQANTLPPSWIFGA